MGSNNQATTQCKTPYAEFSACKQGVQTYFCAKMPRGLSQNATWHFEKRSQHGNSAKLQHLLNLYSKSVEVRKCHAGIFQKAMLAF